MARRALWLGAVILVPLSACDQQESRSSRAPPEVSEIESTSQDVARSGLTSGLRHESRTDAPGNSSFPAGPVICDEPIWDFGHAEPGGERDLTHTFRLRNTSDDAISIERIKPSCGCIIAADQPAVIPAQASADIGVKVTLPPSATDFQKFIDVELATSPRSPLRLTIQGKVQATAALSCDPATLDFGLLSEGQVRTRILHLSRHDKSPVRFRYAAPESSAIRVTSPPTGSGPDSAAELTVTLDGSALEPGEFRSQIVVATQHSRSNEIRVPVRAWMRQPHGFVSCLFVKLKPEGAEEVSLSEGAETAPTVEAVRFEGDAGIAVELVPSERSGRRALVRVSRHGGISQGRLERGHLLAQVPQREKPVRIPLIVHLLE